MIPSTLLLLATFAHAQQFNLVRNYTGSTFFDRWTFYSGVDTNNTGNVLFQPHDVAQQTGLIQTLPNGNVIIKVDNTTSGVGNPMFGRPSVKLLSNDQLSKGDLLIMDAVHMPYGCSVWPGYWTQGSNWPIDGEIDIVENVNLATNNRMSLHTGQGCTLTNSSAFPETGTLTSTDCFNQTAGNQGCVVTDSRTNSYGAGFAQNNGGAFAMLRDDDGIKQWFFPRGTVPADIVGPNPDPTKWGSTTAFFPATSCSTDFALQTINLDITICGNFAGKTQIYSQTCQGNQTDCLNMVAIPTNYDTAYFEIQFMSVYSTNAAPNSGSSGTISSGTNTGSGSSPTGSGSSSPGGGAVGVTTQQSLFVAVGAAILTSLAAFILF